MIPAGAMALGSSLCLFRSRLPSTECVIAAHGGYDRDNQAFVVPAGVAIHFFALHGEALRGATVDMFGQGDLLRDAVESAYGGTGCVNYLLEKDRGVNNDSRRNNAEISEKLAFNADRRTMLEAGHWGANPAALRPTQRMGFEYARDKAVPRHVVTLRSRTTRHNVTLQTVIERVRRELPQVSTFYCKFCRSLTGDPAPHSRLVGDMTGLDF